MAWALMESKIHNARSRKAARALLRRAVALNPKRHADILKWRVFLDWKDVGEAAVEAVRSALSNGEVGVSNASSAVSLPSSTGDVSGGVAENRGAAVRGGDGGPSLRGQAGLVSGARGVGGDASSSRGRVSLSSSLLQSAAVAVPPSAEAVVTAAAATAGAPAAGAVVVADGGVGASPPPQPVLSGMRAADCVLDSRTRALSAEKERGLSNALLALCKTVGDDLTAEHEESTMGVCKDAREKVMAKHAARFEELAGGLEKMGKSLAGGIGADEGERELSGSWRLVFTTCTTCDRILLRAGMFLSPPPLFYAPSPPPPPPLPSSRLPLSLSPLLPSPNHPSPPIVDTALY